MISRSVYAAALAATAFLGLSACSSYGDGGYGYGRPYASVGIGYGASPYYGWYDDFYYPGTGYYVYDRGGRRHSWNDGQRGYWEGRRGNGRPRANWNGYRTGVSREAWQQRRAAQRVERQQQGASAPRWEGRRDRTPTARPQGSGGGFRGATEAGRRRGN